MTQTLARRIRRCLRQTTALSLPVDSGDHAVAGLPTPQTTLAPAAVLIAILNRRSGPAVLLTRRSERLRRHPGQISFPGGRTDRADDGAAAAALREAAEETALPPSAVEILGTLPDYQTVTDYLITPVVGYVDAPPLLSANPAEVAEIFEVPLDVVLDRDRYRRDSYVRDGRRRSFYALSYRSRYIWGATAAMLLSLATVLATGNLNDESIH